MKVFIRHDGDRSVGIPGDEVQIQFFWSMDDFDNIYDRKQFRQELKEFWSNFFDFPCGVRFEDECEDCGAILEQRPHSTYYKPCQSQQCQALNHEEDI